MRFAGLPFIQVRVSEEEVVSRVFEAPPKAKRREAKLVA